jgi:uncharacterized protein YunC (DUF1805 family)
VVELTPVPLGDGYAVGVVVQLPRTRLVAAAVPAGYIMCGALDVGLLDRLLAERRVVAGRALGVRSLQDLLERPLESVTRAAQELGVREGMSGREALLRLLRAPASAEPPPAGRLPL